MFADVASRTKVPSFAFDVGAGPTNVFLGFSRTSGWLEWLIMLGTFSLQKISFVFGSNSDDNNICVRGVLEYTHTYTRICTHTRWCVGVLSAG